MSDDYFKLKNMGGKSVFIARAISYCGEFCVSSDNHSAAFARDRNCVRDLRSSGMLRSIWW